MTLSRDDDIVYMEVLRQRAFQKGSQHGGSAFTFALTTLVLICSLFLPNVTVLCSLGMFLSGGLTVYAVGQSRVWFRIAETATRSINLVQTILKEKGHE